MAVQMLNTELLPDAMAVQMLKTELLPDAMAVHMLNTQLLPDAMAVHMLNTELLPDAMSVQMLNTELLPDAMAVQMLNTQSCHCILSRGPTAVTSFKCKLTCKIGIAFGLWADPYPCDPEQVSHCIIPGCVRVSAMCSILRILQLLDPQCNELPPALNTKSSLQPKGTRVRQQFLKRLSGVSGTVTTKTCLHVILRCSFDLFAS
jgi:hypothetical protein